MTWLLEPYFQKPALGLGFAIQGGHGGASLVALHFDKAKSLAASGKDIGRQVDCAYGAEVREEGSHGPLGRVVGQIANEESFQELKSE